MPRHSWNSNHVIGHLMLFELSRHSVIIIGIQKISVIKASANIAANAYRLSWHDDAEFFPTLVLYVHRQMA